MEGGGTFREVSNGVHSGHFGKNGGDACVAVHVGVHAGAEVSSPFLSLCLLECMQKDVAADGGGDDNSHGFQIKGIVNCSIEFMVHLVGD